MTFPIFSALLAHMLPHDNGNQMTKVPKTHTDSVHVLLGVIFTVDSCFLAVFPFMLSSHLVQIAASPLDS